MKLKTLTYLCCTLLITLPIKEGRANEQLKSNTKEKMLKNKKCTIPNNILIYLNENKDKFKLIEKNEYHPSINKKITCPSIASGDFNNNGSEDFAIIVRYKDYKNTIYKNYTFPFLLVFNDYNKKTINPTVIYKSEDYSKDVIQTVIYDQFQEGIYSFIKKEKVCENDTITILIPEKSTFYLNWNSDFKKYTYINSADFNCNKKQNKKTKESMTENETKVEWLKDRSLEKDTTEITIGSQTLDINHDNQWLNAPVKYKVKKCKNNITKVALTYMGNSISGKIFTLHNTKNTIKIDKIETFTLSNGDYDEICTDNFSKDNNTYRVEHTDYQTMKCDIWNGEKNICDDH